MIDLVYVGLEKPVKEKFEPVKNLDCWTKPVEDRGFWVSPMCEDGKSCWQHWLENWHGHSLDELKHWHIVMEQGTRILEADMGLYNIRPYLVKARAGVVPYIIDYEKMSCDYDFLFVPDEVQKRHKMGVFMGYDVPTGLFLHPTFRALDDGEFEDFKKQQEQRQKEDEELMKDPFIQKMVKALLAKEIDADQARAILEHKLQDMHDK